MSDLISRQDAVDEIQMLLEQSEDDEHDKTWNNAIRGAVNAVKHHTKSAQPEIIRCKDCKYKPSWREGVKEEFRDGFELIFPDWRDNPCPCQCDDGFYAHMPDDNWFCANGKAR